MALGRSKRCSKASSIASLQAVRLASMVGGVPALQGDADAGLLRLKLPVPRSSSSRTQQQLSSSRAECQTQLNTSRSSPPCSSPHRKTRRPNHVCRTFHTRTTLSSGSRDREQADGGSGEAGMQRRTMQRQQCRRRAGRLRNCIISPCLSVATMPSSHT